MRPQGAVLRGCHTPASMRSRETSAPRFERWKAKGRDREECARPGPQLVRVHPSPDALAPHEGDEWTAARQSGGWSWGQSRVVGRTNVSRTREADSCAGRGGLEVRV